LETNIKPTFFQNIVEVSHSYCGTLLRENSELSDKVPWNNEQKGIFSKYSYIKLLYFKFRKVTYLLL